jgi:proteasome assembly chaperone (PAC2) family protein
MYRENNHQPVYREKPGYSTQITPEGKKVMDSCLVMHNQPELLSPYVVVGFRGWLNAGEVSTGSIDYLCRKLSAHKFAHIESRDFYIYQIPSSSPEQSLRPHARIEAGVIKRLEVPTNEFFFWKSGASHDLILFSGVEPNLQWPEYAQAILDLARRFQATRIYALGGVFDQAPHTRETRFFSVVSHPRLVDEIKTFAPFLNYEGPCSFTTMLMSLADKQGIEAAGITARTPFYIQDFNSKACYDLLKKVLALTRLDIDLSDLNQAGEGLVELMDRSFSQSQTAMEQLKKLELMFDASLPEGPNQIPSEDYSKLMEEMFRMKKEGRKFH